MSQSYADIAHERDELKCEIATLRSLMDRMLEKGKKLDEENKIHKNNAKQVKEVINKFCKSECKTKIHLCESCLLLKIQDILDEVGNADKT